MRTPFSPWRASAVLLVTTLATTLALPAAHAKLAITEIPGSAGDGPVTIYYRSDAPEAPLVLGGGVLRLSLARDAPTTTANATGNGRLVVISHGSGGGPWVHADLARRLADAGFVVAMPTHRGDNTRDDGEPGPVSWARRPAEVSRAIDAVARDPRFAPALKLDRVGVYGQSAGGHTALSLAGGRWSPARFRDHCRAHIAEDFNACVGLATRLTGGPLDGFKQWLALRILGSRFSDEADQSHHDARIAAVVAGNPAAADFDPASLAAPAVPLGLITTRGDRWLGPRFHGDRILAACRPRCEHLADLASGGHGALLSPLPAGFDGLLGDLLNDPPGFDRAAEVPALEARIVDFMRRHLLGTLGTTP